MDRRENAEERTERVMTGQLSKGSLPSKPQLSRQRVTNQAVGRAQARKECNQWTHHPSLGSILLRL